MSRVIVVTGIPGAGKSTISRLLAEALPRSVLIAGDDLRRMIVGGYQDPNRPWDEEMRRQYYLSFENAAALTSNVQRHGFTVVIDDVIRKGDLYDEWMRRFAGIDHTVILLRPSLQTALERNDQRPEKTVPESTLRDLHERYQGADNAGWIVIDTSTQTAEQTLAVIRERLAV
jgi:tRNA uridine 5-carbamoylmethylation protein Kti12